MDNRIRREYRLISGDGHVNEPPDLWTRRLPAKYASRAPRIESFENGDAWVIEGIADPINFGLNASAGMPASKQKAWMRFEEVRRGGWDPAARLEEMDEDGVDAEIMYPTPRLSFGVLTNDDKAFSLAMVQAYNDWLSEYCAHAPDRLWGLAMMPLAGVDAALAEFERCLKLPGMRGAFIPAYPNGTTTLTADDDRFFAAVAASGTPLSIHVGLSVAKPTAHKMKLPGDTRFYDAPVRMLELLWAGVFDRFPALKVVFAEVDCGWVPFFKEQTDNRYHRMAAANRLTLTAPPSEYFDRHVFYTYITDTYAVRNRVGVGVENMLWSSDYPHTGGDWPYSWRTIDATFNGVPKPERELILAGNALRLYGGKAA
ncbi:MAG: amidohydrolase family protein [Gammaproteobacteria bacterium]